MRKGARRGSDGNLAGAVATVVLLVIDHAELSRSDALYQFFGMNHKLALPRTLKHGGMIFGRMAYLEAHTS